MVYMVRVKGVLWFWSGFLKLHSFRTDQSGAAISWDVRNIRDTQRRSPGGAAANVSDINAGASSSIVKWTSRLWVAMGGKQHGALRGTEDRDPLKWVALQLCGCLTPPLESHPASTHHIWTPPKSTPGSTMGPRPRQRNPRVAVAACQTTDGVSLLVQTGREHDPSKPWGHIRLLEQWQLD